MIGRPRSERVAGTLLPLVALAGGAVALATRRVGAGSLAVAVLVGAAGVAAPSRDPAPAGPRRPAAGRWAGAVLVGTAAFAGVRVLSPALASIVGFTGLPVPLPLSPPDAAWGLGAGVVAAVAEEAFFRRLLYGWLLRWGAAPAIVGSAVAFAAVHLPLYGAGAVPLDLAAGALLGWQRWATGGWSAPAVTHGVANLLAMG